MPHGLDDVARARLALRADHRRALADPAECLAEVPASADERHLEVVLFDVVDLIRRRQHLRLVDVIDPERLEDLRLNEVANAHLRHHRNRHRLHDPHDDFRVRHSRNPAGRAPNVYAATARAR